MATTFIVAIPDSYTCRGITFLPQQYSGPVPAGEYDVLDAQDVTYSDLGTIRRGRGVPLVNMETGATWYVSVQVGEFLTREHARDVATMSSETAANCRASEGA